MTVYEILTSSGGVVLLALTLVQIAPIKVNPWTWLGRAIGKAINHDIKEEMKAEIKSLNEKVDGLNERQIAYEKKTNEEGMDACRSRILRFGDECRREMKHSREFFDQILEDVTRYEHYCDNHPEYENSKAALTIEKIKKIYNKCDEEDSFL